MRIKFHMHAIKIGWRSASKLSRRHTSQHVVQFPSYRVRMREKIKKSRSALVSILNLCTFPFSVIKETWLWAVESSWNVMAHGDARAGKWRGNWRMEWVASTLHTISEHGVSSITTADAHTSAASSRLNWRPHRFKWTGPFRRKTKSGFCAYAITFQTQ
jgi:hypothetical protein